MKKEKQKKLITEELTWEQHVICGNQSYESGRTDEALLEYDKALILNPNNSLIYHNRGILYYNMEKNQEALLDYNKAIALNPMDSKIYNNRGNLYSDLARQEEALDDFNQAIQLDPNFSDAYNSRAMLYVDLGRNLEALSDFDKAIELKAQSNVYKNRGILLFNLNRFDEALKDFNEAISHTKRDSTLYLNSEMKKLQSIITYQSNQIVMIRWLIKVEQYFTQIQVKSNQPFLTFLKQQYQNQMILMHITIEAIIFNNNLANQYWKQNQLNLALQDFNKSIRLNPKYQNAYDCRGNLYLEMGQTSKAESDFNKSIELNSRSSNSYNNRGNYLVNLGNYHEALKNYEEAIQLEPYNSLYLTNLGELHLKMNDIQQASLCLLQADTHLKINKNSSFTSIHQFISKILPILLEIITSFEKEIFLIKTLPLDSQVKLQQINEIKRIETSVVSKLIAILQPISLQSNQNYLFNQIDQLQLIIQDIRINFSLIYQTLQMEQIVDINEVNITTIQTEIASLKNEQNNNKYYYFKSLCYNLISFMQFCLDIQQADKIIKVSSTQKEEQELFPNQFCTFKSEDYIIQHEIMGSLFETIFCKALGYQDNFKQIIIDRNFAQLYFIQNTFSKKLEIEFHLLAIELAQQQQEIPEINSFTDCVETVSRIQMKEIPIASNIFWKKGILDSIKIIQFIDNNINRILSDGLQYLRMFKEEFFSEEVIVIQESLHQSLMAVPTLRNEQTTYCSFCSIQ
ncbi:unnamed protein product [Paramecium pentaurelia]|uniref:Tetratricopeptide repeat protein n=1 Tax=Paramecium pentaurelia TaxID=43138 RepID=A0A8S1WFE7_9CILI|nr:unnamed protein product [Paramecium pentaurelia]